MITGRIPRFLRIILTLLAAIVLMFVSIVLLTYAFSTPSNDRDWSEDQKILPHAEFGGSLVTLRNIRNFSYLSETEFIPEYYDKTFNLENLVSVDFIVEPLAPVAVAHTFVSFGFKNGEYVAVSVEIRKEKGESFGPIEGILDQYELMYVIVDERDTLRLRVLERGDELYLYPAKVSKEKMRELFVSMLTRANTLKDNPEFYNTITSTCTTNIVDHINEITEGRVPWDLRLILPLDADEYAYELGLIDTSLPLTEIRERYRVTELVKEHADDPMFSYKIRESLGVLPQ